MSNFNKFFFLSAFLFTLSSFNLQAMVDEQTLSSRDLQHLSEGSSLFLPVFKGDTELVEMLIQNAETKDKLNSEVIGGRCNGYTALRLSIDMWFKKIVCRGSDRRRQAYKNIAQILIDNGAGFTEDMGESLREMGVSLPERTGASYWRHTRKMGQEVDDLSKLS
ncbi:MAG: hypothetical protein WCS92_05110 [Candidatus Babeliales bacterium]|jgi:hypothetical protein